MKVIYKKRLKSPITQIIPYKNTFSFITKSNKQYVHPDIEIKLPFTPDRFVELNEKFFYLHKTKVFFEANQRFTSIRLPNKILNISTNSSALLLTEKKILKIGFEAGRYTILDQMYGPTMHISSISPFEDKILALCFGSSSIYLFNKKDHLVFNGKNLMTACCLIDDENFVVSEGSRLYFYHVAKRTSQADLELGHDINVICSGLEGLFVGCTDGYCAYVENNRIEDEFQVDGCIIDIKIVNMNVIVASGYDRNRSKSNKKVKNMLTIFEGKKTK